MPNMKLVLPVFLLILAVGCRRPPDAPVELDDLCAFLFAHFADEDTWWLEPGVDNLHLWLDGVDEEGNPRLDQTLEGYAVHNLTEEDLLTVESEATTLVDLAGAAVGFDSAFAVDDMAEPLIIEEQEVVFPDSYDAHEREFLTDPDCFFDHECDYVKTTNHVEASYALGLKVTTEAIAEYRWVPHRGEWALLHRTYLLQPAEVSMSFIDVNAQYYVGATLPQEDGTALRLSTTWISARLGSGAPPEAAALNLVINSMIKDGETLDEYLGGDE